MQNNHEFVKDNFTVYMESRSVQTKEGFDLDAYANTYCLSPLPKLTRELFKYHEFNFKNGNHPELRVSFFDYTPSGYGVGLVNAYALEPEFTGQMIDRFALSIGASDFQTSAAQEIPFRKHIAAEIETMDQLISKGDLMISRNPILSAAVRRT